MGRVRGQIMLGLSALACAVTLAWLVAGTGGATTTARSFHGDLRKLTLKRTQVPRGFVPNGPAIHQDLYDESSPHQEPWLYVGDVRHGQLVTAAFSEFQKRNGIRLDSETYRAPTMRAAHAMFHAASELAQHSANGVDVDRVVGREDIGTQAVLLRGPGLNGEGAQAIVWRDGLLFGMVALDGTAVRTGEHLATQLAIRQETIFEQALRHHG